MRKKVVDKRFAKSKEYANVISEIESIGKCPFCSDNFKYHKNPILKSYGAWFISKTSWPYKNSKHHFIIIGKKHKESFLELTEKDFKSVKHLTNWVIKKFKIKGGALAMRFGDTTFTGATVCHIHFHLISPEKDKKSKKAKTVNFPIG